MQPRSAKYAGNRNDARYGGKKRQELGWRLCRVEEEIEVTVNR